MPHQFERLTTRILHPHDPIPSTEDIFSSALEVLFTDDTQQSHGIPGQSIIYRSPSYGDVYLQIPAHPGEEGGRLLFAHYLWNAAVIAAEGIERASCDDGEDTYGSSVTCDESKEGAAAEQVQDDGKQDEGAEIQKWDKRFWDMRGRNVLELGAATGLPSIISALSNARTVTATDHPSSPAIITNAIAFNLDINFHDRNTSTSTSTSTISTHPPSSTNTSTSTAYTNDSIPRLHHPPTTSTTQTSIYGYAWGTTTFFSSHAYGTPAPTTAQPALHSFDRIIIADCLWMPAQHENLITTIQRYLQKVEATDEASTDAHERGEKLRHGGVVPCALVVAGFHTGREVVRDFITLATGDAMGGRDQESDGSKAAVQGRLRAADICEVGVDGHRRAWAPTRPGESKEQSKRWCMCAVLVRR